jgi:hypothetical protein
MAGRFVLYILLTLLLCSCATESIEDRRYGQQLVCHDGEKTLTVSNADNLAHLNHGDSAGPCPESDS